MVNTAGITCVELIKLLDQSQNIVICSLASDTASVPMLFLHLYSSSECEVRYLLYLRFDSSWQHQ